MCVHIYISYSDICISYHIFFRTITKKIGTPVKIITDIYTAAQ